MTITIANFGYNNIYVAVYNTITGYMARTLERVLRLRVFFHPQALDNI
jgi:hypothetical protein